MNANSIIAVGYLRLSREEATAGESSSIKTQRTMITDYCNRQGINIVRFYADDGWSGSNFNRPGFQEMMQELENGIVNTVITKDLSRLGRDMREASYFAEQFFPEHGIRYLTIADNFDNSKDNIMAPFQFAMNEVYLRDCSKKVRDALKTKRENGQYCACAPYRHSHFPNGCQRDVLRENLIGTESGRRDAASEVQSVVPGRFWRRRSCQSVRLLEPNDR